jgi:Ca2+-binding EF-hand superfamily protein
MLFRSLVCLLLAGLASAQPPGREGGFFRFSPILSALDTDHDGSLSADEIGNAPKALRTLDKNNDGKITADELRPSFGPGGRGGPGGPEGPGGRGEGPSDATANINAELVKTLLEFDKDGDFQLTRDEVPARFQGLFERWDANKDGKLTRDELTKGASTQRAQTTRQGGPEGGRGQRLDPIMSALDTDNDGALSASEIDNSPAALKKLDKNGDGRLTEDEVRPNMGPMRGGPPREEK